MWLSYLLRIFEKIYYQSQGQLVFDSYITAIWCVVITMTTVGYGDVFAVSPFGRTISIINALWGAFVISMLVSSIGKIFDLSDRQKKAIAEITNKKQIVKAVKASMRFNVAKRELRRHQEAAKEEGNDQNVDYVPTKQDLERLKAKMTENVDQMRTERRDNEDLIPEDVHGTHLEVVKEQIIDLNDKFDFLITLMLKGNKLGYVQDDFTLDDRVDPSLNRGSAGLHSEEVVSAVEAFEMKARQVTGDRRKQFRKPAPKKKLTERVQEAIDRKSVV